MILVVSLFGRNSGPPLRTLTPQIAFSELFLEVQVRA